MIRELRKDGLTVAPVSDHGVVVTRPGRPDAVAYCCEFTTTATVTAQTVADALHELPDAKMIIVFPSRQLVDPEAYDLARECGVCLDTFGGFSTAINDYDDIACYQHREEKYLRGSCFTRTRGVASVLRKGHRAWLLERTNGLRPLTVVTNDQYEITAHQLVAELEQYPELAPDAFVGTNPSTSGFSSRVIETTQDAGIRLFTMKEFLRTLREPWT
jgi:hypothetical protein